MTGPAGPSFPKPGPPKRRAELSVVTVPDEPKPDAGNRRPRYWHLFEGHLGDERVLEELVDTLVVVKPRQAALDQAELVTRLKEFAAVYRRAQAGTLRADQWCHVRLRDRLPLMWEMRWTWHVMDEGVADPDDDEPRKIRCRGYFIEPSAPHEDQSVLMLAHVKQTTGGRLAIKTAQDQQMQEASRRVDEGSSDAWGLRFSQPFDAGSLAGSESV